MNKKLLFPLAALCLLLAFAVAACSVEVPGGVDDFSVTTPTSSAPTPTPVIIAPALQGTPTRVAPPPTPTRAAATQAAAQPTALPPTEAPASPTVPLAAASGDTGEMISVPGGSFQMGSDDGDPDEQPPHPVDVAAFQIDRFEVTNSRFDAFAQATGYQTENEKAGKPQTWRTSFTPETAENPVVVVSWNDAQAFCEWAGKRLPTEAEWEFAARGTDGRTFPWGIDYDTAKFNGKASGIRGTVHVGSYPAGASAFGVDDMAGNVWEWTADWYQAYPGGAPSEFFGERFRVTRGGGWFDEENQVRASNRSSADPAGANPDLGFRCAQ
jgi:formylglycine-generating enzyme required for sulfatase activity